MKSDLKFNPNFYSGLSGLIIHIPKYLFTPPYENASRLTFYSTLNNSIEFNSTFYKVPQPKTVLKWSESVNENFVFTFKLWKEITHCKNFDFKKKDVDLYINSVNNVNNKKGCLLIQLPPSVGNEYILQLNNLLKYLCDIETSGWKIAVEFRNKSWYNDKTYDLLNKYKVALVIHDIPKSATPTINHKSNFLYIRFHGPDGNYRDTYVDDFLREYAIYVNERIAENKKVFIYFNNTMGDALNNLKTIRGFVKS